MVEIAAKHIKLNHSYEDALKVLEVSVEKWRNFNSLMEENKRPGQHC